MIKKLTLAQEYARWKGWARKVVGHVKRKPKPKPKPFTPLEGCDYVSGPTPAQLKAAGMGFVVRYVSTPGNPKNLTLTEAKELHQAGLGIVLVFETTANRALGGLKAGRTDAKSARAQAKQIGYPDAAPIYYAVDFDMQPDQAKKVVGYFVGAASVDGHANVGVYGGLAAVKAVLDAKACLYAWQTYGWSGSPTVWDHRRHLEQYENGFVIGGHSVDRDRAVKPEFGAWTG